MGYSVRMTCRLSAACWSDWTNRVWTLGDDGSRMSAVLLFRRAVWQFLSSEESHPHGESICVLYDDPVVDIPNPMPATVCRAGTLSRRPDACPRPRRSISRRGNSWAAFPANWGCASSWKRPATNWSSPPTRTAPDSTLDKELPDAEIVISQPFWPAYMTAERIAKAPS